MNKLLVFKLLEENGKKSVLTKKNSKEIKIDNPYIEGILIQGFNVFKTKRIVIDEQSGQVYIGRKTKNHELNSENYLMSPQSWQLCKNLIKQIIDHFKNS